MTDCYMYFLQLEFGFLRRAASCSDGRLPTRPRTNSGVRLL